jgi:hypothetical protein
MTTRTRLLRCPGCGIAHRVSAEAVAVRCGVCNANIPTWHTAGQSDKEIIANEPNG